MMIRTFCDRCEEEVTNNYAGVEIHRLAPLAWKVKDVLITLHLCEKCNMILDNMLYLLREGD